MSAAAVLLGSAHASAGGGIDPNVGDEVLGTTGGVRYASDRVTYDALSSSAEIEVGCGGSRWHVLGGGSAAGGPVGLAWQTSDRTTDFDDADTDLDDGWRGGGAGMSPAELTAYSVCIRSDDIRHPWRNIAVSTSGLRSGSVACGGAAWHVTSGSVFIATTGSWVNSSYPMDGPDADHRPDDGWQGSIYDVNGGSGGFSAYAVCVQGEVLRYVRRGPFSVAPGEAHRHRVACRSDEHVVGGGARLSGPEDRGRLVASYPSDGGDADDIPDDGWTSRVYNVAGAAKRMTAYAVCLG
ncbi:MAG: hypothetical protein ACXWW5_03560 [Actinomycetota bacterium]